MMAEEDMFMTQDQPGQDSDSVYLNIAAAIAVRKCKVVQKKEKIKLGINTVKLLNKEIKLINNETKSRNKEKEEVAHQETFRVENIKGVVESRASLDIVFSDLKNKVTIEKTENKKKLDEYKSALQNATEIWKSYQRQYNAFPLARKRNEIRVELKKNNINLKSTKLCIEDLKQMEKLKIEIRDKRHQVWLVKLAKAYFKIQEGEAKTIAILNKKRELENQIEDIKVKKKSKIHADVSKPTPSTRQITTPEVQMTETAKVLEFKVPQFQITSPPYSRSAAVPTRGSLFDWTALLGSSFGKHFDLSKKTQNKRVEMIKPTSDYMLSTNTVQKTNSLSNQISEMHKEKTYEDNRKTALSTLPLKSLNKLNDKVSVVHKKVEDNISGLKNKNHIEDNSVEENKRKQIQKPIKTKSSSQDFQSKKNLDITMMTEDSNKWVSLIQKKSNANTSKTINNEDNCKESESPSCITRTKPDMSSFMAESKNKTKAVSKPKISMCENLMKSISSAKQSGVQKQVHESQKSISYENTLPPLNSHLEENPNSPINYQTKLQHDSHQEKEEELFMKDSTENQPDNVTMTMDPNSPPDIIPVENNSQYSASQGHLSQGASGKFPSQSFSDLISPSELDEEAKLHYQRIAAESPVFVYPRGPGFKNLKSGAQATEVAGHSQYFQKLPSADLQTLNTPTMQDDYQPSYSPPANFHLNNNSTSMNSVTSPPITNSRVFSFDKNSNAETSLFDKPTNMDGSKSPDGVFSFDKNSNAEMSLFDKPTNMEGSKSPDGAFSFNFMNGASNTTKSFFSLF